MVPNTFAAEQGACDIDDINDGLLLGIHNGIDDGYWLEFLIALMMAHYLE